MDAVVPWARLVALIEPYYPKGSDGGPPLGLEQHAADGGNLRGGQDPAGRAAAAPDRGNHREARYGDDRRLGDVSGAGCQWQDRVRGEIVARRTIHRLNSGSDE